MIEGSSTSPPILLRHQPSYPSSPSSPRQLLLPSQPLPDRPLPEGEGDEGVLVDGQPRVPAEEVLQVVSIGQEEVGLGVSWGE